MAEPAVAPAAAPAAEVASLDYNQLVREGHYEAPLVQEQVCGCADAAAVATVCRVVWDMCWLCQQHAHGVLVTHFLWCIP